MPVCISEIIYCGKTNHTHPSHIIHLYIELYPMEALTIAFLSIWIVLAGHFDFRSTLVHVYKKIEDTCINAVKIVQAITITFDSSHLVCRTKPTFWLESTCTKTSWPDELSTLHPSGTGVATDDLWTNTSGMLEDGKGMLAFKSIPWNIFSKIYSTA